jgi:hypothetical protein
MFELIRQRIARRRFLMGGAAAGIGVSAGSARMVEAGLASTRGDGALASASVQAQGGRPEGGAILTRQGGDAPSARWDYSPITR